jgi:hypothetical protein
MKRFLKEELELFIDALKTWALACGKNPFMWIAWLLFSAILVVASLFTWPLDLPNYFKSGRN